MPYYPNKIEQRLAELDMAKAELARRLGPGWSPQRITRLAVWCSYQPGVTTAIRIARILETTVEVLWPEGEEVAH